MELICERAGRALCSGPLSKEKLSYEGRDSVSARALEFAILTADRTGEVIGAKWSEIDLKAATWTVPADRMKAGKAHTVPLSDRAVEILRHLGSNTTKVATGFVFLNGFGKPISNMAMAELVKGMGATCTVHGFRSTFSDWAHDRTGYAPDVIEHALAHTIKNKTAAAYRRDTALDKRVQLMAAWARYCEGQGVAGADVVPIRA
jgi:integrase